VVGGCELRLSLDVEGSVLTFHYRFFDLFVAMCNHMDDMAALTKSPRTPR